MNIEDVLLSILSFLILIIGGTIAYLLIFSGIKENTQHREAIRRCEEIGGIILDRTYTSGKTTGHSYTCIKKDVILNLD